MSVHVSAWCWEHSKASGVDLLILLAIADQADDDGRNAWPSHVTLARRCRVSMKTTQRSTQRLEELGELAVERRSGPASQGATNQRPNSYSFPAYRASHKTRQPDASSGGGSSDRPTPLRGSKQRQADVSSLGEAASTSPRLEGERGDNLTRRGDTAVSPDPSLDPSLTSKTSTSGTAAPPPDHDPPRPDVEALCNRLADRMVDNGCLRPTITRGWRDAARLLLDKDGREQGKALALIDWCQADEFWKSNIQSMPKFRTQYDKLRLRALADWEGKQDKLRTNGHQPYRNPDPSAYLEESGG